MLLIIIHKLEFYFDINLLFQILKFEYLEFLHNKYQLLLLKKLRAIVFKAPISPPILIIKNISKAGKPIKIKKNVFICLIQNYIIHVYLSNYE